MRSPEVGWIQGCLFYLIYFSQQFHEGSVFYSHKEIKAFRVLIICPKTHSFEVMKVAWKLGWDDSRSLSFNEPYLLICYQAFSVSLGKVTVQLEPQFHQLFNAEWGQRGSENLTSGIPARSETSADKDDKNFREDLGTQSLWTLHPSWGKKKRVMPHTRVPRAFGWDC